jgi:hypothetical protein
MDEDKITHVYSGNGLYIIGHEGNAINLYSIVALRVLCLILLGVINYIFLDETIKVNLDSASYRYLLIFGAVISLVIVISFHIAQRRSHLGFSLLGFLAQSIAGVYFIQLDLTSASFTDSTLIYALILISLSFQAVSIILSTSLAFQPAMVFICITTLLYCVALYFIFVLPFFNTIKGPGIFGFLAITGDQEIPTLEFTVNPVVWYVIGGIVGIAIIAGLIYWRKTGINLFNPRTIAEEMGRIVDNWRSLRS